MKELTARITSLLRYSRNVDFDYSPRNTFPRDIEMKPSTQMTANSGASLKNFAFIPQLNSHSFIRFLQPLTHVDYRCKLTPRLRFPVPGSRFPFLLLVISAFAYQKLYLLKGRDFDHSSSRNSQRYLLSALLTSAVVVKTWVCKAALIQAGSQIWFQSMLWSDFHKS